jgi:asparagine synthase (glutamine-hydrolysing)
MVGLHGIVYWDSNECPTDSRNQLPPAGRYSSSNFTEITIPGTGHLHVFGHSGRVQVSESPEYTLVLLGNTCELSESDTHSLIDEIRSRPQQALNRLPSEFALCALDSRNRSVLLATDAFGTHPLYYAESSSSCRFSTDLSSLSTHGDSVPRLSDQAIFDFLYFTAVPGPDTIFSGIHRTLPGHMVHIERSRPRLLKWYSPAATSSASAEMFEQRLITGLRESIRHRWHDKERACFLSGGLDSSTVCALASEISESPVKAFSIGFRDDEYDEIGYARIAAKKYGLEHHVHYVSPDAVRERIDTIASAFGEPFANASAITALICAEESYKNGVRTLLAGDGGDELFAGNERYAKQMLLQRFYLLPKPLRAMLSGAVANKRARGPRLLRKGISYVQQAALPFARRLQHYNFIEQYGVENIFSKRFLGKIDAEKPVDHIQTLFESAPFDDALKRMLFVDWNITLADNDLRKVRVACEIAGVDVTFPMLGAEVASVAEEIPARYLMPQGRLRGFYKNAVREILPTSIIDKPKHGFGVPVGRWLTQDAKFANLVQSRLSALEERDILLPEFLAAVRQAHQTEDAVHFGVILWTAFMLETWLEASGH